MTADQNPPCPPVGELRRLIMDAVRRADVDYCRENGEPRCSEEDVQWRGHVADAILSALPRREGDAVAWGCFDGDVLDEKLVYRSEDRARAASQAFGTPPLDVRPLYASPITGGGEGLGALQPQEAAFVTTGDVLPDPASHKTGWAAKKIDGKWRVGMAGNLDTRHDAVLTVHKPFADPEGESQAVAEWIAATYNAALLAQPGAGEWEPTIVVVPEDQEVIVHKSGRHPRAEVRDSETGEVIFPARKGPLTVIRSPLPAAPDTSRTATADQDGKGGE